MFAVRGGPILVLTPDVGSAAIQSKTAPERDSSGEARQEAALC